jgi:hypothetical protein
MVSDGKISTARARGFARSRKDEVRHDVSGIWWGSVTFGAVRLPTAAVVVVALLGAVQLALFIWALIDLIRRPRPSLLPRWAWLVLVVIFELLGPILYLALGRGEPPVADETPFGGRPSGAAELDESSAQRTVDMLYGPTPPAPPRGDAGDAAPQGDAGRAAADDRVGHNEMSGA